MAKDIDLGYRAYGMDTLDLSIARVTAEHRELYRVRNATCEYWAKVTGKHMFAAQSREDYPAVGDWVEIGEIDGDHTTILKVLPRKTMLRRKYAGKDDAQLIATNIDAAFVVESANRDFNLNRLERYFVLAKDGGIEPIAVLNKADLVSIEELEDMKQRVMERIGKATVISMSAKDGDGLQALKDLIEPGRTYCLLGSSGVGKSTIINRLLEEDAIDTQEISEATGRGKHTTTAREMHFLKGGGIVIDNPGTREVGVADSEEGVRSTFDDIEELVRQCRFSDCTHTHEKGCAVKQALEQGTIDRKRLENYQKLLEESNKFEMTKLERREKGKMFGKMVKNVKKDLKGRKGY